MRARATPEHEGSVRVLDAVRVALGLCTDAELAEALGVCPPHVAKQKRKPITEAMLLHLHDATGTPVNELRAIAGLPTVAPYQRK